MSVHQLPDGRWFVAYREGSRQKRTYTGKGDVAEIKALQLDEEIRRNRGRLKEETITLKELCLLYHEGHPRQLSTVRNDFYKFKIILKAIGHHPAEILSPRILDDYIQRRIASGKKRTTLARDVRLLKAVYSWAESQEPSIIARNPIAKYRLKNVNDASVPYPPSHQEVQKLMNVAEPHLQRALMLHHHLGIRPGRELLSLTWEEVDFSGRTLKVTSARKGGPSIRFIPISGLIEHLLRWKDQDEQSFGQHVYQCCIVNVRGKCVSSIKTAWKTAKIRAGITRKLRLYDLRHAFVTEALRDGSDLKSVSQIIGHSRPDTTLREYQHVDSEQIRKVIERVKPLVLEV